MTAALDDWRRCAAAGMTMAEAAGHRGVSVKAAYMAHYLHGVEFRKEARQPPPEHPNVRACRECAAAGMTTRQAAEKLGKTPKYVSNTARRHGFTFPREKRQPRAPREAWEACAAAGMTMAGAARRLGLSRNCAIRARRVHGIKFRSGGPIQLSALTEKQAEEYRFLTKRYGYCRAEALRAIGRADLVEA